MVLGGRVDSVTADIERDRAWMRCSCGLSASRRLGEVGGVRDVHVAP